jgi:hypothetical protein
MLPQFYPSHSLTIFAALAALAAPAGEEVAPTPAVAVDLSRVIPVDRPRGFINCLRDAMGLHDYPDVYHGIIVSFFHYQSKV